MAKMASGGRIVRFGEFRLDLQSGELDQGGDRVILAEQPFRLLAVLIRERGALVTREDLRRELWPDGTFVDFESSLNAAVKRVREALHDSAATPRFIETLPKRGYRFIAAVDDGPEAVTGRNRARRKGIAIPTLTIATMALLTLVVMVWSVRTGRTSRTAGVRIDRLTNDGTVLLAAISPDGRELAYVRREGVRESLWLKKGEPSTARRLLGPLDGTFRSLTFASGDTLHFTLFRPDKTAAGAFRLPTAGGKPERLSEAAGRISFSPDGSRYTHISTFSLTLRESRIIVAGTDGTHARVIGVRRPPHSYIYTTPAWSPDGTQLAVFGVSETAPMSPELLVLDANSGNVSTSKRLELVVVDGALWLSNGREIVIAGRQRSATPQHLWLFSLADGGLRQLTTDLSDYRLVGSSAAGQLLAVRGDVARSLWVAELNSPEAEQEVTQNAGDLGELEGLAWLSKDEILYTAAENGNVDILAISLSNRVRRRLTTDPADDFHPSTTADGGRVVFASTRGESPGIWTMDSDGGGQTRLTSGADVRPSISRDGRLLVFQRGAVDTTPFTLWRLSIREKTPAQIADMHSMRPAVSPDSRAIAHYWMTAEAWLLAITPTAGGPPERSIPISATHAARVVRWSPDGSAIAFIDGAGGASNIWVQPLEGGAARKLTHFSEGRISTFDWSPDGSKLAWIRVHEVRDVVTMDIDRSQR